MNTLLYDSDRMRLATLARDVQDLGLKWISLTSLDDVQKELKKKQFDLLILDGSAVTIINQLKKFGAGVPIIFIVEDDSHINYEKIIYEGVEGIISRPYKIDTFKKIIDKAITKRSEILSNLKTVASLKQKVQELQTLNEVVQAINSSLQPKEILRIIMEKTADLIKAEGWSVLLLDYVRVWTNRQNLLQNQFSVYP
jgi:DNA-binding NtrC family response regulator